MKTYMKTFLRGIWSSSFLIFSLRKPVNTFLPFLFTSNYSKQAMIWMTGEYYKADYYANLDKSSHYFLEYISRKMPLTSSVLDIGCNQGRFLIGLEKKGFRELYGVDVMSSAIEILQAYEGAKGNKIEAKCDLVQNYLANCKEKSIDYAIT